MDPKDLFKISTGYPLTFTYLVQLYSVELGIFLLRLMRFTVQFTITFINAFSDKVSLLFADVAVIMKLYRPEIGGKSMKCT